MNYFKNYDISMSYQINDSVIDKFIKTRLHFVKNTTINKEICSLKTTLNLMIETGYDEKNISYLQML